jgi:hypothetical protein
MNKNLIRIGSDFWNLKFEKKIKNGGRKIWNQGANGRLSSS